MVDKEHQESASSPQQLQGQNLPDVSIFRTPESVQGLQLPKKDCELDHSSFQPTPAPGTAAVTASHPLLCSHSSLHTAYGSQRGQKGPSPLHTPAPDHRGAGRQAATGYRRYTFPHCRKLPSSGCSDFQETYKISTCSSPPPFLFSPFGS